MAVKSKFGGNGEFQPDWRPPVAAPVLLSFEITSKIADSDHLKAIEGPPEPIPEPEAPVRAKPGWRVVHKRPERKPARTVPKITGAPTPLPQALPEPPKPVQETPAWAQWRRTYILLHF